MLVSPKSENKTKENFSSEINVEFMSANVLALCEVVNLNRVLSVTAKQVMEKTVTARIQLTILRSVCYVQACYIPLAFLILYLMLLGFFIRYLTRAVSASVQATSPKLGSFNINESSFTSMSP